MSKGYVVCPLMKQPRENVIDEELIRDCIYLKPASSSDEDRLRVVGNREEAILKEKMAHEVAVMSLHKVTSLLVSFRRIGKIENLHGLQNLTKLCLDNNHISKIENIGHLTKLTCLDLSFNQITVIEGLESLKELDSLNLFSNSISAVSGLDGLKNLTALSLGSNKIENLDDTARYLHQLKKLRVLTFKGCKLENLPHYRVRLLAFVSTLRFLDGKAVKESEVSQAREEQRENLMPIDEEDERVAANEKAALEEEKKRKEYEWNNCPDETKLCDELFQLNPDGFNMMEIVKSDILITSTKELIDRFQAEFNEKAKELADAMKAVRQRRDEDEKNYQNALLSYEHQNTTKSLNLMKNFESALKQYIPRGIGTKEAIILEKDVIVHLRQLLTALKSDLLEREAEQVDVYETLNNATVAKWKRDQADVLLQTSFENLGKAEADFQSSLKQAFDLVFEQRQKREHTSSDDFYFSKVDEAIAALMENRDDYQKVLGEWFELRRRRLEELELHHLHEEDKLLTNRQKLIVQTEQDRHRHKVNEIDTYCVQLEEMINAHC